MSEDELADQAPNRDDGLPAASGGADRRPAYGPAVASSSLAATDSAAGAGGARPRASAGRWLAGAALLFLAGAGVGVLFSSPGPADAGAADGALAGATDEALAGAGGSPAEGAMAGARSSGGPGGTTAVPTSEEDAPALSPSRRTPIVEAARRVGPSVVSVMVVRQVQRPRTFFDEFFGRGGGTRAVPGLGSGFAIDREGTLLTNHHVVRDADSIVVVDEGGRIYAAELVGADELTDLAVLRIAAGRIPPAPLGTSSDLLVGEPAIAIGNPSGFMLANTESTVTSGVISGVGRDILSGSEREVLYADMVQTDAAINPGNSGGPLVNADGEVVGVNSSIFSRSGGSEGLGFAIPIDRALRIADELRQHGRIRRPWVGVEVASVQTDSLIRLPVVQRVAPESPGSRAGIQEGDVVLSLDGRSVRSPLDWEVALLDAGVGGRVQLRLRRDGRESTAVLRVEELPSERAERVEVLRGVQLVSVTPQIASERDLGADQGALIVEVDRRTASATGFRRGDVIVAINRREVRDASEAAELFRYYSSSTGWVRVWINRGGSTFITTFALR